MKFDLTKILESFNNLSDQVRYACLVALVLLIILLDVFVLALPQVSSIADINDQIKKLSDDTQEILVDRPRINVLRKILKDSNLQLRTLSNKVRPMQEVPLILSAISSFANQEGVKIDELDPEKGSQELLTSTPEGKYYALPVVIKARCGYHMFGRFLNKLENADLSFLMKDFIIQNDDKNSSAHLFSLTIKIILVNRNS